MRRWTIVGSTEIAHAARTSRDSAAAAPTGIAASIALSYHLAPIQRRETDAKHENELENCPETAVAGRPDGSGPGGCERARSRATGSGPACDGGTIYFF